MSSEFTSNNYKKIVPNLVSFTFQESYLLSISLDMSDIEG